MAKFTQKYTLVTFINDVPDGYEFSMKDWPDHITLADVFAIDGAWENLFIDLKSKFKNETKFLSRGSVNEYLGEDQSIKVTLVRKTDDLKALHEKIIAILENHGVVFNSPQYTKAGFKPHSTEQAESSLEVGDIVEFGSVTLIDMFPNDNPYRRRVLGTIHFA